MIDPYTGLPNRAAFRARLAEEIARAEAGGWTLAVVVVTLVPSPGLARLAAQGAEAGREVADRLVLAMAEQLRAATARSGFAARIDAEEFALLLPQASLERAAAVAQHGCDTMRQASAGPEPEQVDPIGYAAAAGVAVTTPSRRVAASALWFKASARSIAAGLAGGNRVWAEAADVAGDERMTRIFFDTEFTRFDQPELLSLGMVSEDGREFYVERQEPELLGDCDPFVRDNVLPQFGRLPNAGVATLDELAQRTADFLLSFGAPLELCFDYKKDRQLLESILRAAGRWDALADRIDERNVADIVSAPAARAAGVAAYDAMRAPPLAAHHALADARALRAAWLAAHGQGNAE